MNVSQGRGARRVALAFTLFLVSVLGHSAAAGSLPALPALPGMLGALAVSTALAFAVADQRRSMLWLFGYLLAGQLLLHTVMSAMGHHAFALIPDRQMLIAHVLAAGVAAVLFEVRGVGACVVQGRPSIPGRSAPAASHSPGCFDRSRTTRTCALASHLASLCRVLARTPGADLAHPFAVPSFSR